MGREGKKENKVEGGEEEKNYSLLIVFPYT